MVNKTKKITKKKIYSIKKRQSKFFFRSPKLRTSFYLMLLLSCLALGNFLFFSNIILETSANETSISSNSLKSSNEITTNSSATSFSESSSTIYSAQSPTSTSINNLSTSSSSSSTSSENYPKEIIPSLKFVNLKEGAVLKKTYPIEMLVPGVQKIELYLVRVNSTVKQYLGKAQNVKDDLWVLEANFYNVPNGTYKLLAEITTLFGTYYSSLRIEVKNSPQSSEPPISTMPEIIEKDDTSKKTEAPEAQEKEINIIRKRIEENQKNTPYSTPITSPFQETKKSIAGSLPSDIDSDNDGLSNDEEKRIGSNPLSADSDQDGFLDGDEVRNGYNLLKPAAEGDKIIYENPREKGEVRKDILKIEKIGLTLPSSSSNQISTENQLRKEKGLKISGKGLPYSFVTIYIYSEIPTIVTVMTDDKGNWSYTMDKELEDGQHEVYVAVTDNQGHITAKSEPFFFIKTAQAVTPLSEKDKLAQNIASVQSPVAASQPRRIFILAVIALSSLSIAILVIGLYLVHHLRHREDIIFPPKK